MCHGAAPAGAAPSRSEGRVARASWDRSQCSRIVIKRCSGLATIPVGRAKPQRRRRPRFVTGIGPPSAFLPDCQTRADQVDVERSIQHTTLVMWETRREACGRIGQCQAQRPRSRRLAGQRTALLAARRKHLATRTKVAPGPISDVTTRAIHKGDTEHLAANQFRRRACSALRVAYRTRPDLTKPVGWQLRTSNWHDRARPPDNEQCRDSDTLCHTTQLAFNLTWRHLDDRRRHLITNADCGQAFVNFGAGYVPKICLTFFSGLTAPKMTFVGIGD